MLFILAVAKIAALIALGVFTPREKLFFPSNPELLCGVSALHPASLLSAAFQHAAQGNHFGKDFSAGTRVPDGSLCGS